MPENQTGYRRLAGPALLLSLVTAAPLSAAPGDVLFSDNFERNNIAPWSRSNNQRAGIASGADFSNSPTRGGYTRYNTVTVTSPTITGPASFDTVSVWIRRGADSFSENPDGFENFVVEYLDDVSNWVALESFAGSGSPGQVFNRTYNLPPAGRHAGFRMRFRQEDGSGGSFDFWHVDDLCFNARPLPALRVAKVSRTVYDPINLTTNPFAIPGSIAEYTISVTNEGEGDVDAGTIAIEDIIGDDVELFVDTTSGDPIRFVDGAVPSGLSFSYAADVTFSSQPGGAPPFDYVPPVTDFDPAITAVRIAPSGTMNGGAPGSNPSFQIVLQVRVR